MKPTRFYSGRQEKQVAQNLKGRVQINSGATPLYKGDVKTKHFLIEAKTTTTPKDSFSIKKEWLKQIKKEAFAQRLIPVIAFRYEPEGEDFYIIDGVAMKTFNLFLEAESERK